MSSIQKTLDSLQPYVIGIRYVEKVPVVDFLLKDNWVILPSDQINTISSKEANLNYYMLYPKDDSNIGLDELLEFAANVINANNERELTHKLLNEKIIELKELFKKNQLSKLKKLKFVFTDELDELPEIRIDELEIKPVESKIEPEIVPQEMPEVPEEEDIEIEEEERRYNNFMTKRTSTKVELPPKPIANDGPCSCGPEEACSRCIEEKSL